MPPTIISIIVNDCYKYVTYPVTNVVVIIDPIRFIMEKYHTKKEELEASQKGEEEEENSESKEPDYNEDTEGEEEQEKETGEMNK
jgi:hypothetical protein